MAKKKYLAPKEETKTEAPSADVDGRITASKWMERIRRAIRYRDKIKKEQEWDRLIKEYAGNYSRELGVPINLVFGYVDTASSRIYFRDPYMSINPKGSDSIGAARIMELDVNYSYRSMNLKRTARQILLDAFLIGHGWVKLGYKSSMGEMVSDMGTEPAEFIKNEEIFISYIPWEDIVFDTQMSKLPPYDCRWIAHRIVRPVLEMKKDNNYENTGKIESNVRSRDTKDAEDRNRTEAGNDSDNDLFEFWEITDLDTRKIYAVSDQSDKFHRESDYIYKMNGLNYSMLAFNRSNDKPYPISDVFLIEPQILERIKLRSAQVNHMKRWGRQLSVEEGTMKPEEVEKFSKGIDGGVIQRRTGSQPPVPIEYAPLPAEIFVIDNLLQADIDAVIGQSDLDRGAPPKTNSRTTKYQLQEQSQGTGIRQSSKQDKLEDFLEEITDKYIALVKQFQDVPKYVRITGKKPEEIQKEFGSIPGVIVEGNGIKYTKEAIQGECDVEAKAGSTMPLNRENKLKLIDMALERGQALGVVPGSPVAIALGKGFFRELDMIEVQEAYDQQAEMMANTPPPSPMPPQDAGPKNDNVQHHVHHVGPPAMPSPGPISPPVQ